MMMMMMTTTTTRRRRRRRRRWRRWDDTTRRRRDNDDDETTTMTMTTMTMLSSTTDTLFQWCQVLLGLSVWVFSEVCECMMGYTEWPCSFLSAKHSTVLTSCIWYELFVLSCQRPYWNMKTMWWTFDNSTVRLTRTGCRTSWMCLRGLCRSLARKVCWTKMCCTKLAFDCTLNQIVRYHLLNTCHAYWLMMYSSADECYTHLLRLTLCICTFDLF